LRYVDDNFLIRTHRSEKQGGFLPHLKSIYSNIHITTETEREVASPSWI
jgi:hypothetical protein